MSCDEFGARVAPDFVRRNFCVVKIHSRSAFGTWARYSVLSDDVAGEIPAYPAPKATFDAGCVGVRVEETDRPREHPL